MRKSNWTLEILFFTSLGAFTRVLFSYPKILIQFFFDKGINNFFISDLNMFTQRYIYNNFFLGYLVYMPFFIIIMMVGSCNLVSKETSSFCVRIGIGFTYYHFFAIYINQRMFSTQSQQDIASFFDNKIQALDLNYRIRQYYGFYWDFFVISYCYFLWFMVFTEKPWSGLPVIYYFDQSVYQKKIDFWSPFLVIWIVRVVSRLFTIYFFGGQCLFSDILVLACAIIRVEIIVFSHRFFCILQRLKLRIKSSC